MGWKFGLLALVLVTPVACATAIEGHLDVEGTLTLPTSASLQSVPIAVFMDAPTRGEGLRGDASVAIVHVFEDRYLTANALGQEPRVATGTDRPTWTVHDVHLSVEPENQGWMGLHPGGGLLTEVHSGSVDLASDPHASVGNGDSGPDDMEQPFYLVRASAPTIVRSADAWTYAGETVLKILGPTVVISSRENTTTIETGEFSGDQPGEQIRRMVAIELRSSRLASDGPETRIVSPAAFASWDGAARAGSAKGTLDGGLREWRARGGDQVVDGRLDADIKASATGLELALLGDLRSTTLSTQVAVPAGASASWTWIALALAAVAVGGVAASRHARIRRERRRTIDAEEYATLAERAADVEDFERAERLIEQARLASPSSRRLALDHASYLSLAGRTPEAIRLLQDPLLTNEADAHLLLARLQLEVADDAAAAESLCRALRLSPPVLLDLDNDPHYASLVTRADVSAAVREARRKLA